MARFGHDPKLFRIYEYPNLKSNKGKKVKSFYNESDYLQWKQQNEGGKGWKIKYYKGLGLTTGKSYTAEDAKKQLRYGKLLFMTDQDLDGSHIKGLCINMFHSQWHDLVTIPNFFGV